MTKKTQQPNSQPQQPGEEFAMQQNNPHQSFNEAEGAPLLDNSGGQLNSPSWNKDTPTPVIAPIAPQGVEVIVINRKLQDVQQQAYIFEDKPSGKYILEYHYNGTVMPLPVWWSGSELIA